MPTVPRIRRAVPSGDAVRPVDPIPVVATLTWHSGQTSEVDALAVAWTTSEVEVRWTTPWGDEREDWLLAAHVRRR